MTEGIVMVTKLSLALFALALAAGCDAPDPESVGSEPATVESPDALDESPEKSTQAPEDSVQDPTVEETEDGWATTWETPNVITEDPGCYYTEGLHTEVAALRQVHLDGLLDCDEEWPLIETDPGYEMLYERNGLCKHVADLKLVRDREVVIEDCFDEDTQWFHEDHCASLLAAVELTACVNGKPSTIEVWDSCAAIRDARYDDAMASGECDVEV